MEIKFYHDDLSYVMMNINSQDFAEKASFYKIRIGLITKEFEDRFCLTDRTRIVKEKRSYHVDTRRHTYAVKTTLLSVSDEEVLYCSRYLTIIVMLVFGVLDYSCVLDS